MPWPSEPSVEALNALLQILRSARCFGNDTKLFGGLLDDTLIYVTQAIM
ncbi:hypothetical protein PENCOP_c010G04498 [Penicillium coprophilum]|uniref:Uncharacterized protein n=1 Tax=Penicillium coprophilum TaxID=36646 RepID=A0A1V6UF64_9EURO|nr:hypothetical protein PENCOP_c010G04498 [Penicillium coprophilum]